MKGCGVRRSINGALLAATLFAAGAGGLALPHAARAEAAPADPIDTAMQNCLARADRSSTLGQVQCVGEARDAWSGAIEAAQRSIDANAPDKLRRGWDESQRRWLAWRKEETPLVRAVFATTRGTAYAMTEANIVLQTVRDRALALRRAAASFANEAQAPQATSRPQAQPQPQTVDPADKPAPRMPACSLDAACEHAQFDLSRYYRTLREKLPASSRPALWHAQRAWSAYFSATAPLDGQTARVDLIGARLATLKHLSDAVGNN
jgi:uncharacterized protein YecT (DUF1311 family)